MTSIGPAARLQRFRDRLPSDAVIGPFSKTTDPAMIEVMGLSGFDFVILDTEHGPHDPSSLGTLIRAAECSGCLPIVRTVHHEDVSRALDLGAAGVQVPHVDSAESAKRVVAAARFSPGGARGVCRYVRAAAHSLTPREQYFQQADQALVIVQVEGEAGLNAIDEILEVRGIDIVFVGVYDLSQSLGVLGEVDHPRVREALGRVAKACQRRLMAMGTFVESPQAAAAYRSIGVSYLCYGVDVGLVASACRATLDDIAGALKASETGA